MVTSTACRSATAAMAVHVVPMPDGDAQEQRSISSGAPGDASLLATTCNVGLALFFAALLVVSARHSVMFLRAYGRRHRLCGLCLLVWLCVGFVSGVVNLPWLPHLAFDVVLGVLGTLTAVTAAFDFRKAHARVRNLASGTLEREATVTFSEMIEHSFYQGLNLAQALFLHAIASGAAGASHAPAGPSGGPPTSLLPHTSITLPARLMLALVATSPWLFRHRFPVNRFRDNYTRGQNKWTLVALLYRAKKYQYVFYKHALLHGLHISVAVSGVSIVHDAGFRLYWLCLNTSYVMEFFLQTLVKKGHLRQWVMLTLQQLLMAVSTIAAVHVLVQAVLPLAAIVSLALNFAHPKHDVANTAVTMLVVVVVRHGWQ